MLVPEKYYNRPLSLHLSVILADVRTLYEKVIITKRLRPHNIVTCHVIKYHDVSHDVKYHTMKCHVMKSIYSSQYPVVSIQCLQKHECNVALKHECTDSSFFTRSFWSEGWTEQTSGNLPSSVLPI